MAEKTYWKILLLMKRKPGTTMAQFEDYYENNHVNVLKVEDYQLNLVGDKRTKKK